jgi:hypothetical protein
MQKPKEEELLANFQPKTMQNRFLFSTVAVAPRRRQRWDA